MTYKYGVFSLESRRGWGLRGEPSSRELSVKCQLGGGSEGTSSYEARKGGLSALPP